MKLPLSSIKSRIGQSEHLKQMLDFGKGFGTDVLKSTHPLAAAYAAQGLYFYQNKQYGKAQEVFQKAVGIDAENAYLNFKLGMSFYKTSDWLRAEQYIQKAIDLDPKKGAIWQTQLTTAKKHLEDNTKLRVAEAKKNITQNPNSPEAIWDYALSLANNKQYWLAQFQLEKYIALKPNSVQALEQLGKICESLSDHKTAFSYFQKASQQEPFNRNFKYRMGYNLEKLEYFNEAEICYDLVINMSSSEDEVHQFGIGALHAKRGLWDSALLAYEKYKDKNNSNDPELFYRMGIANERLYNWLESAQCFAKAIELSEVIKADWCFKCGQAYERATDYKNAATYYKQAVIRSSDYKDYWLFRLAYSLEQCGNFEESAKYYQQSRRRKFAHAVNPKDVIKNKEEEYLSYYTEYYETLPVDDKQVLLESFFGGSISCNPYAILSYMLDQGYDYTYIVVIKPETIIPDNLKYKKNIIFINRGSDAYLRYLCTAKYLINNVTFPFYFIRKPEQIYLNTWHGTPMKTLGKDIKSPFQDHANVSRNFLHATHIISPNRHTTNIILDKYDIKDLFSGQIAETGYPRIDLSLNLTSTRRKEILDLLGFTNNKPIVFYAPTWRGTSQSKDFDTRKLQEDLNYLKSEKYNLVFRGHHLVESLLSKIDLNVVVAPKTIDSNELLGVCDVLITDYSSIVYDYLALNKPAITYVYDFEEYKQERGLYFEKDEMVGVVCTTTAEVSKSILDCIKNPAKNIKLEDVERFAYLDDGCATKRVVDFMLNNSNSYVYNYYRKETTVLYTGPFIPNGISRSFLNLISSLSFANKNIMVLINGFDVAKDQKRLEVFNELPKNISVLSRAGRMPMTLEEIWVRYKFEECFNYYSNEFRQVIERIYRRESRRLFGDSKISNIVNFEGYSLFWALLIANTQAEQRFIYQHNDKYQEWIGKYPYLKGVFNTYAYYTKVVSVSQKTMENNRNNLYKLFNIDWEKFDYCNNPINIDQILSGSQENIEMEDEFTQFTGIKFINIGRMSHEKDQLKLIDAFAEVHAKYPATRLYILGDGLLKDDLMARIQKHQLGGSVYLLGQKPNPFPYLKQADVFVLSSNHEGQPMVLLESLTLGTPIIATDIVGNRSILGDDYGLLVKNNKIGLVQGMCQYIESGPRQDEFDPYAYQDNALNKFKSLLAMEE